MNTGEYLQLDTSGGDLWSTRQVYDLTDILELIKTTSPVVTHYQYVGLVVKNVLTFEGQTIFLEYLVYITNSTNDCGAFMVTVYGELSLFRVVELVGTHTHNKAVSLFESALDNSQVANMEQVVGTERDDGPRLLFSSSVFRHDEYGKEIVSLLNRNGEPLAVDGNREEGKGHRVLEQQHRGKKMTIFGPSSSGFFSSLQRQVSASSR